MSLLKSYLMFAASSMIAACALITLSTRTAHAQSLTIGNTQSNPAMTRDVDVYARRPILVQAGVGLKDGVSYTDYDGEVLISGLGAGVKPQEIPKGYRFVVEHIWGTAALLSGETVHVELNLPLSGKNGEDTTYSFALKDGAMTGGAAGLSTRPAIFRPTYNEAVRLYVDPGDISVRFSLNRPFTGSTTIIRNVRVCLSGYVEKIPSVAVRPAPLFGAAAIEDPSNNQQ